MAHAPLGKQKRSPRTAIAAPPTGRIVQVDRLVPQLHGAQSQANGERWSRVLARSAVHLTRSVTPAARMSAPASYTAWPIAKKPPGVALGNKKGYPAKAPLANQAWYRSKPK